MLVDQHQGSISNHILGGRQSWTTGIPVYNVNNNCSTGSSALYLAKQIVEGGNADCVLALGFEKMERGSLSSKVNYLTH